MSRVRTFTPIEEVDRLAVETGLELTVDGDARTFSAFRREYRIETAEPGKVGLFSLTVHEPDGGRVEGLFVRGTLRRLFRSAAYSQEAGA